MTIDKMGSANPAVWIIMTGCSLVMALVASLVAVLELGLKDMWHVQNLSSSPSPTQVYAMKSDPMPLPAGLPDDVKIQKPKSFKANPAGIRPAQLAPAKTGKQNGQRPQN